jgi:hypothetical protein
MLSKCANPGCSTAFRYLREGKLFEIDNSTIAIASADSKKPVHRVEFFWLCGPCSSELTVVKDRDRGVVTVPLSKAAPVLVRRAAAS